jgi:hypothetical protein
MKLIATFLRTPLPDETSVSVYGEFTDIAEARTIAIDTATKNPFFLGWCLAFDLEDANGTVVSRWDKDSNAPGA